MNFSSFRYLVREGFRNVWANRLMSVASVAVLFSCLLLIGASVLFSVNAGSALNMVESQNVAMVFLKDGLSDEQTEQIGATIQGMPNISSCEFVSKEEAFQRQLATMGEEEAAFFEGMDDMNVLPDAYQISVKDLSGYDETISAVQAIDGVDEINGQSSLAATLSSVRRAVTIVGTALIAMMFLISLFIIANTIKITMYSRRLQISIMKAVGATDWFVRVPFVIEGMILGIVSGLLTLSVLYYAYKALLVYLSGTIGGFQFVSFGSIAWYLLAAFILIGVIAGVFGSLISIGKYLKREGSDFSAV